MTPSQLEHLKLIDAHLERQLAIAEKRTPGEWMSRASCGGPLISTNPESVLPIARTDIGEPFRPIKEAKANATFIASCAGNAEAGWRATRAVIKRFHDSAICREWHGYMQTAVEPILAAFPLELIQKP